MGSKLVGELCFTSACFYQVKKVTVALWVCWQSLRENVHVYACAWMCLCVQSEAIPSFCVLRELSATNEDKACKTSTPAPLSHEPPIKLRTPHLRYTESCNHFHLSRLSGWVARGQAWHIPISKILEEEIISDVLGQPDNAWPSVVALGPMSERHSSLSWHRAPEKSITFPNDPTTNFADHAVNLELGTSWGTWVTQSVKHLTLGFGSGHELTVCEIEPCGILSPSLSAPPPSHSK